MATAAALLAEAAELARRSGQPRYVAPAVDPETGGVALAILDAEPEGDHVRVGPDGSAVAVYLPDV